MFFVFNLCYSIVSFLVSQSSCLVIKRAGCLTLICSCCCVAVIVQCLFLMVPWVSLWSLIAAGLGLWQFLVILTCFLS